MSYNDFYYGLSLLDTLYGIEMEEDDYAEIALVGWNMIGNKRYKMGVSSVCASEGYADMPCEADDIEAITSGFDETGGAFVGPAAAVEHFLESVKMFRDPLYVRGKLIKYHIADNRIYFDRPWDRVNIYYREEILDDNDLPYITDSEARALATYVAWISKYKEGLQTNNPNILKIADTLHSQWYVFCDQARSDWRLNQNDMNRVLDAKTSHNRKQHNTSFQAYS